MTIYPGKKKTTFSTENPEVTWIRQNQWFVLYVSLHCYSTSLLVSGLFVCQDIANHICPTNPPDKYQIKSASIYMMYVDIL